MGLFNFFSNASKIVNLHKSVSSQFQKRATVILRESGHAKEAVFCALGIFCTDIFLRKIFKIGPNTFFIFIPQLDPEKFLVFYKTVVIWFIDVHLKFSRILWPDTTNDLDHDKLIEYLNSISGITQGDYAKLAIFYNEKTSTPEINFYILLASLVGADPNDTATQKFITTASGESYSEVLKSFNFI